jgi:hypothetical protein
MIFHGWLFVCVTAVICVRHEMVFTLEITQRFASSPVTIIRQYFYPNTTLRPMTCDDSAHVCFHMYIYNREFMPLHLNVANQLISVGLLVVRYLHRTCSRRHVVSLGYRGYH